MVVCCTVDQHARNTTMMDHGNAVSFTRVGFTYIRSLKWGQQFLQRALLLQLGDRPKNPISSSILPINLHSWKWIIPILSHWQHSVLPESCFRLNTLWMQLIRAKCPLAWQVRIWLSWLWLATNGVVIATEKKVPTILIEEESIQKIVPLSENIGVVEGAVLFS